MPVSWNTEKPIDVDLNFPDSEKLIGEVDTQTAWTVCEECRLIPRFVNSSSRTKRKQTLTEKQKQALGKWASYSDQCHRYCEAKRREGSVVSVALARATTAAPSTRAPSEGPQEFAVNDDEEDLITNWDAPDMHTNSGVEPSMRSFDPETGQKGRLETSTGRSSTRTSTGKKQRKAQRAFDKFGAFDEEGRPLPTERAVMLQEGINRQDAEELAGRGRLLEANIDAHNEALPPYNEQWNALRERIMGQVSSELREIPVYSRAEISREEWEEFHLRVLKKKKPGAVCAWCTIKYPDTRWCALCDKWCTIDLENDAHLQSDGKDGHVPIAVMCIHMDRVVGKAIMNKGLRNFSQSYPQGAPDFSRETNLAYWGDLLFMFARRVEERHKEGAVIRIEFSSGKGSSKWWYEPQPDEIKEWNVWLTLYAGKGKYESNKIAQIPWAACPDKMSEIKAIPESARRRLGLLPGTKEMGYWPLACPTFVPKTNRKLIDQGYVTETFPGSGVPDCTMGICLFQYLSKGTQKDPLIGWPSKHVQMRVLAQDERGKEAQHVVLDTTDYLKAKKEWQTKLDETTTLSEWINQASISRKGDPVMASLFLQSNLLRVYLVDVDSHGNRCHPVPPPIKKKKGEGEIDDVDFLARYLNHMDLT